MGRVPPLIPSKDLLTFIDSSPTPFHCVHSLVSRLKGSGYEEISEQNSWVLKPGRGYFTHRNYSSLIAFRMGHETAEEGYRIIGAHTDSPNLRIRFAPPFEGNSYQQFEIEVYGGALWNSWLDRDLSLAGRVFFKEGSFKLVKFEIPLARVPQLAIHLDRGINEKGLQLNPQIHLNPLVGSSDPARPVKEVFDHFLAEEVGCSPQEILHYDLQLYDTQKSVFSGINGEFIHAPRLDNQAMCHSALLALLNQGEKIGPTPIISLFDHEEVGSVSEVGAQGSFLESVLERVSNSESPGREEHLKILAKSIFLSSDMAHALHPNYPEKHGQRDFPVLNGGPVLKINANQRYTTEGFGIQIILNLARSLECPIQRFVNRNDLRCGSTIGPTVSSNLGIPAVDLGNPLLSMHSIREMTGTLDHQRMIRLMGEFFHLSLKKYSRIPLENRNSNHETF